MKKERKKICNRMKENVTEKKEISERKTEKTPDRKERKLKEK